MADRPRGYGMTAELQAKQDAKYDVQQEEEARNWIQSVINEDISTPESSGMPAGAKRFQEELKDGQVLCKLINVISPGSVAKINSSKMAFKQMENIGKFLDACGKYGMAKSDQFQTVDLYEGQNMAAVVSTIHALGRKAQSKGFGGPTLGPKEAQANRREFSQEQLDAGKNVIGLQMGSNKGASQSGMNFGNTRHIMD